MNKAWWRAAGIRAIRTWAQTLLATIPTSVMIGGNTDWSLVGLTAANIIGTAVLAGVLSLLTSIAGLPEVDYKK
ncbi:MAG: holin [Thermoleophilia bacterium]